MKRLFVIRIGLVGAARLLLNNWFHLQLLLDVLGFELVDSLDEVSLLDASPAFLAPVVQDLLQLFYSHLLQIHLAPVQRFLVFEFTDLRVLLLQLFANVRDGNVIGERLGDVVDHGGGGVVSAADVVAEAVILSLGLLAVLPESSFNVRLAFDLLRLHSLHQVAQELFAHFTL